MDPEAGLLDAGGLVARELLRLLSMGRKTSIFVVVATSFNPSAASGPESCLSSYTPVTLPVGSSPQGAINDMKLDECPCVEE